MAGVERQRAPSFDRHCWGLGRASTPATHFEASYLFVVRRICFRLPRTFDWSIFLRRWANLVAGLRPGFGLFCDILLWFPLLCDTVSITE